MQCVLTVPAGHCGAGNKASMLALPPISKDRPRKHLRKLPPRVHSCSCGAWILLAAWDTGELRMLANDHDTVWECVDRSKQRRKFEQWTIWQWKEQKQSCNL